MMAIFSEAAICEIFKLKKKKPKTSDKPSSSNRKDYSGKYTKIEVNSANSSIFDRLYNNEALTAEGMEIKSDDSLEKINNWFRTNSQCDASNVDIFVIRGKAMNDNYHLTDDNRYDDDFTIVCIDWVKAGCKSPYKGGWRWFSDVVDNNARREIAKKNPYYDHYNSIYYGNIGNKD